MNKIDSNETDIKIPEKFIVFIPGVPGAGKSTISYELLKVFREFRIIEETDLIREILRGYNDYIKTEFGDKAAFIFEKIEVYDHMKFLSFYEAKQQCGYMKKSLEKIVARQQRKGIPSIVNGVHIIPEVLNGIAENQNIIFINLFINNENELYNRLKERNPNKYSLDKIPLIYQTNIDLRLSTLKLAADDRNIFSCIDVTNLTIKETLQEIILCFRQRLSHKY